MTHYRIVGLAGRGATGPEGEDERHEPFLVDLDIEAEAEPDLAELAQVAAEALAWYAATVTERAERIAAEVLRLDHVSAVEVDLHRPEAPLGVPVIDVEVRLSRSTASPAVVVAPAIPAVPVVPAAPDVPVAPAVAVTPVVPAELPPPVDAAVPALAPAEVLAPAAALPSLPGPPEVSEPPEPAFAVEHESGEVPPVRRPSAQAGGLARIVLSRTGADAAVDLARTVAGLRVAYGFELGQVSPLARLVTASGELHTVVVVGTSILGPGELLDAATEAAAPHGVIAEILAIDGLIGEFDGVELPLPGAAASAAVLAPWSQVEPTAVLPGLGGGPVVALAQTAPDRDAVKWLALDWLD